jgi:phosphoglycolate phosphatase-like HAD superfamily hydrolase
MTLKSIIFDFDGVIAESMDIKTEGFKHLFKDYPQDIIDKVVKLHLDHGGMSRFEKFRIIYEVYIGKELTKSEEERLGKEFTEFCLKKTISSPYVKGVDKFMEDNYTKYLFFIVSGTPHDEINTIVDERGLRKYFKGVWGTPRKKGELIKMILEEYDLTPDDVAFIGDAPTDYDGAMEAKVIFIARIAEGRYNPFESGDFDLKYIINDFSGFDEVINKVNL